LGTVPKRVEYPPEFYQQRVQRIVSEASTKLEPLTPKTRDRLESIPKLFRQIFAATEPHYAQFECHSCRYRWTSAWTMRAPNFFGDVTAILLSEKFLNKGRAPRILTLGDITRILTPGNITRILTPGNITYNSFGSASCGYHRYYRTATEARRLGTTTPRPFTYPSLQSTQQIIDRIAHLRFF